MVALTREYKQQLYAAILALIVLFVIFGSVPYNTLFWREVQNTGHSILFAIVAILVLLLLQHRVKERGESLVRLVIGAALISMVLGVIVEIAQLTINSDGSTLDVLRDAGGILFALILYAGLNIDNYEQGANSKLRTKKTGLIITSIFIFSICLFPLVKISWVILQRDIAFPVVLDLTTGWSKSLVEYNQAKLITYDGLERSGLEGEVALLELSVAKYPGISLIEPFPDWTSYRVLLLPVYSNNTAPLDIVLRIHDAFHNNNYSDRFNRSFTIYNGVNYLRIPLDDIEKSAKGRKIDMSQISNIAIFSEQPLEPVRLAIGVIKLGY